MPHGAVGAYLMEVHVWLTRPINFMIWGGVFTRFPKLKITAAEGTSAWVPDFLDRLEFHYKESRESQKLGDFRGHLAESPADTFRKNFMVGASCMSRKEAEMRHEIGVRNIMWAAISRIRKGAGLSRVNTRSTRFAEFPKTRSRQCSAETPSNSTASMPRSWRRSRRASAPSAARWERS